MTFMTRRKEGVSGIVETTPKPWHNSQFVDFDIGTRSNLGGRPAKSDFFSCFHTETIIPRTGAKPIRSTLQMPVVLIIPNNTPYSDKKIS